MRRSLLFIGTSAVALSLSTGTFAQPEKPAEGWSRSSDKQSRTLSYSSAATVLGQNTHLDATFYCNPEKTKDTTGALGFEVEIRDPGQIKSFHFDDFEGPDAPALKRKLLTAAIVRPSGAAQRFQASPTGWYSVREGFVFEVSEVFYRKGSTARRVLEELRTDATALTLTIVDYRVSSTQLDLTIPMTGRSEDFRRLLAGLPSQ